MKKFLIGVLACLSLNANATLISESNYVIDTDQGLDWLRWDETNNRSYNDILGSMGTGGELEGWEYATSDQAETFLANFNYTSYPGSFWDPTAIVESSSWEQLTSLMGMNDDFYGAPTHQFLYAMVDSTGLSRATSFNHTYYVNDNDPYRHFTQTFGFGESLSLLGSFLVRDTSYIVQPAPPVLLPAQLPMQLPSQLPVQVSEPSTLMLMFLTVAGLFASRRKLND